MNVPYKINFFPSCDNPGGGGFGFSVDLDKGLVEFAKTQELDHQAYEGIGKRILLGAGFRLEAITASMLDEIGVYGWHEQHNGLMVRASVPGCQENNVSLSFSTGDYRFVPHNIDDAQEFAAAFALVNHWLRDIITRM
ncbi:MAG: hypothetical protein PHF67_04245 [Candidatus Nanoarchaeia archaeon]|nr:hypothetical protein [Candidatus Nanoarchaeia archaeon]